jgi:hypothetical protein
MNELRTIELNNGTKLELECTDGLFEAVKQYFSLTSATDITDKHLQEFVISMCQNAVTDAESQVTAQNEPIKERNNMHILDLSQKV